ncbi:hypothetical protein D3C77_347560 [compost metagenome]
MVPGNSETAIPPSSYELLGQRVQRLVSSPHVQKLQAITVLPEPGDRAEDWDRLLDELGNTDGIRIDRLESGAYRIGWREYIDC